MITLLIAMLGASRQITDSQTTLQITEVLAIPPVGGGGRVPFSADPIQKKVVEGHWTPPKAGDTEIGRNGKPRAWADVKADKDGNFSGDAFEGGYAYCQIDSDKDRVEILDATGDSMAYLNGTPIAGDPYGYGWLRLPVHLKAGENDLLILTGRGQLKLNLTPPRAPVTLDTSDLTIPDAVIGVKTHADFGGVVVSNSTEQWAKGLTIEATLPGAGTKTTQIPDIPPLATLKVRCDLPQGSWIQPGEITLDLALRQDRTLLNQASTKFRIRTATQTRKETYISAVDDSVQYYAVVPPPNPKPGMAMILSLHGAGVEAIGQADAYSPKDWGYVVCATNRRPYGFDWEDWGREDGVDVLAIAEKEYKTDDSHTYVTGHSMGGHGTWQFGALFPDKWAAIGASAGWVSFYSYVAVPRAAKPDPLADIFQRAAATTNTLDMKYNYLSEGVYILHGDADDNVPVTEARTMKATLSAFDKDLGYHEQPGANHWWSTPLTKGASCLEWPEMMDYLKAHSIKTGPGVNFTTVDLAVSPSYKGIKILRQEAELRPSNINVSPVGDAAARIIGIDTSNIAAFYLPQAWNDSELFIDGQKVHSDNGYYEKADGKWKASGPEPIAQVGPFKEAFNNHAVLVYGTTGSEEENKWAFDKARYDSESFWYRGNGALKLVSDKDYLKNPDAYGNAILYGNSVSNAAWKTVLGRAPIQVGEGLVSVGDRKLTGDNLAVMFCWRKPGDKRLNAAVSGSGAVGMRLTTRTPYFLSGIGYPDWTIDSPESLSKGMDGVVGAGFFGPDGSVNSGDSVMK